MNAVGEPRTAERGSGSIHMAMFQRKEPSMHRILLASAFLVFTNVALAGDSAILGKQEDQYARGLAAVEQVQNIKDHDIGLVRVSSLDNGPAMNPIGVAISIAAPADEQGGDQLALDTYYVPVNFSDVVSAKVVANDLIIAGRASDTSTGDVKPLVVKVRIKKNGKRLPAPLLLP